MPKVMEYVSKAGRKTYRVRFRLDSVQTTLTFQTKPLAEAFARDVEQRGAAWAWDNYQAEEDDAADLTLSEWAVIYFASATQSAGTLDNYERDWKRRWQPHLGDMKLSRITRADIVAALKVQTGKPKTIENAWGALTVILKGAVEADQLVKSPHVGVKMLTPEYDEDSDDGEHRYLNDVELLQVIEDTHEHYRPLVWMLIGTGMRWGEATALRVSDVDLDAKTVRVMRAWKRDRKNKRFYIGPPKTKKSRRTITLPNEVVEAVRPLVEGRGRKALLFTNTRGEWVKHQTFYREHWLTRTNKKGERRGCTANVADPRPRIHDLRHSHVAMLIARGVSLPVIQARLGHEKITTTIDTYGHLLPDLQIAAADAVDTALASSPRAELVA